MAKQYKNISNEAVKDATGKKWEERFVLLDKEGAGKLSHKEIVPYTNYSEKKSSINLTEEGKTIRALASGTDREIRERIV